MFGATTTTVAIRRGTGTRNIETMRGTWRQAVEFLHDGTPFVAVRTRRRSFQVKDQPMRHLMRHDVFHERPTVLAQQDRIEAQATTREVRLTGPLATQVQPYVGARQ